MDPCIRKRTNLKRFSRKSKFVPEETLPVIESSVNLEKEDTEETTTAEMDQVIASINEAMDVPRMLPSIPPLDVPPVPLFGLPKKHQSLSPKMPDIVKKKENRLVKLN